MSGDILNSVATGKAVLKMMAVIICGLETFRKEIKARVKSRAFYFPKNNDPVAAGEYIF